MSSKSVLGVDVGYGEALKDTSEHYCMELQKPFSSKPYNYIETSLGGSCGVLIF